MRKIATRTEGLYLSTLATVADAESAGVMLAWKEHSTVALDSQGVIQRIWDLQFNAPGSWIEEELVRQVREKPRCLIWVRGYQGTGGNEKADKRAKQEVVMGRDMHQPDIAAPAGIRQAHRIYPRAPAHLRWSARAIKGLVYMVTDKGPQRQWIKEIGKTEEQWWCVMGGHHRMRWVGDGMGRSWQQMWGDERWCEQVAEFHM